MRTYCKLKTVAALLLVSALNLNAHAGSYLKQHGTIIAVDLGNNTFIVSTAGGETNVHNFPTKVNIIINGIVYHDKSLIEPGQAVTLKFSKKVDGTEPADPAQEMTIAGTIIELNQADRNGSLRQDRTNHIVPFRFAEEYKQSRSHRVGDRVVFTYRLDSIRIGMN